MNLSDDIEDGEIVVTSRLWCRTVGHIQRSSLGGAGARGGRGLGGVDEDRPSVGIVRGALATCHCLLHESLSERESWRLFREDYSEELFVRLVRPRRGIHRYPEPKILAGADYCDIGFVGDEGQKRLVVIAAIDNLMKGAAGNAVQTMNLMYGFPEVAGLEFSGLHPNWFGAEPFEERDTP